MKRPTSGTWWKLRNTPPQRLILRPLWPYNQFLAAVPLAPSSPGLTTPAHLPRGQAHCYCRALRARLRAGKPILQCRAAVLHAW